MENFFYDDNFYVDFEELVNHISEEEDLSDLEEDWKIVCREGELQPIFKLSPDWIMSSVNEERFTEDGNEWDKCYEMLSKIQRHFH